MSQGGDVRVLKPGESILSPDVVVSAGGTSGVANAVKYRLAPNLSLPVMEVVFEISGAPYVYSNLGDDESRHAVIDAVVAGKLIAFRFEVNTAGERCVVPETVQIDGVSAGFAPRDREYEAALWAGGRR